MQSVPNRNTQVTSGGCLKLAYIIAVVTGMVLSGCGGGAGRDSQQSAGSGSSVSSGAGSSSGSEAGSGSDPNPGIADPSPTVAIDCGDAAILCVDDSVGTTQEFTTIQNAVSAARPGDRVVVHAGNYAGFSITTSGTASAAIRVEANGGSVVINRAGPSGDGVRLQDVSYVVIEGFDIRNSGTNSPRIFRCIAVRGATATRPMTGNVLRGNRCTNADAEGIYVSQFGNGLIEQNVISASGASGAARSHGIYLANAGGDGTIIRANQIYDNANAESNGIHCNGDLTIGGDGLIQDITIERNTIYGNGQNGINLDGVQGASIVNNLIYGNVRHAVRAYQIDGASGPRDLRFINNTLLADNAWSIKVSEDGGGHVVFNNILSSTGSGGSLSVGHPSLVSNYNSTSDRMSADDEATVISLTQWRSLTGADINSRADARSQLFVDYASGDYRLAVTSPVIDAGRASLASGTAPTVDIVGVARPQGDAHDIGAYESR